MKNKKQVINSLLFDSMILNQTQTDNDFKIAKPTIHTAYNATFCRYDNSSYWFGFQNKYLRKNYGNL